jgi:hypothetical protein
MEAAFRTGPTFRMGFDEHIIAFNKHVQRVVWSLYWSSPAFQADYDAKLSRQRAKAASFFDSHPIGAVA